MVARELGIMKQFKGQGQGKPTFRSISQVNSAFFFLDRVRVELCSQTICSLSCKTLTACFGFPFDVLAWLCVSCLLAASRAANIFTGHEWAETAGVYLASRRRSYVRRVVSLLLGSPSGPTAPTSAPFEASRVLRLCSFSFFPTDSQAKERLLSWPNLTYL